MATNPITLTNGTIAYASDVETKVNPLYTDITNANISASAAISYTKMDGTTSISLSSTASFSQSGSGTAVFSSTATDPFRFHGSGDSYGGGSKILRLTCDNVAGGGFTFLQAIADLNGTPNILLSITDRGVVANGTGMDTFGTASGVSTYTLSGVTTAATTCAIGIVGAQTSNAVVSQLDFYNASSGSADKRLASIKVSRNGADNTGIYGFTLANAGTISTVFEVSLTQFQIATALDFSVGAGKKVHFDNFGDTYIFQNGDGRIDVVTNANTYFTIDASNSVPFQIKTHALLLATNKLYFDGGSDSSIYEVSANKIVVETGGSSAISFDTTQVTVESGRNFAVQPTKGVYYDNGGNTYHVESSGDVLDTVVGGTVAMRINSSGEVLMPAVSSPTANYANRNSFVKAWGKFNSSGGTLSAYNCSCSRTGTGSYTVTWATDFNGGEFAIAASTIGSLGFVRVQATFAGTALLVTYNTSFAVTDFDFSVIAIGTQ